MTEDSNSPPQDPVAGILALVAGLDVENLIMRYDIDFDAPMRQAEAIGMLRLAGAHTVDSSAGTRGIARRVGAHWCEIIHADVTYELHSALRLIESSRSDAERLLTLLGAESAADPADLFTPYVVARWYDGTGRVRYRLGSYTAARLAFETAVHVAERAGLWWALPDLLSNHARAEAEERGQAARERTGPGNAVAFVHAMEATRDTIVAQAAAAGVDVLSVPGATTPLRHREFLRGYSNALHSLATALRQAAETERSLRVGGASKAISEGLNDTYRTSQSLLNQVFCGDRPQERLETLRDLGHGRELYSGAGWERGRRIARQQLAGRAGAAGLTDLKHLLDELEQEAAGSGRQSALDVDFYAYTLGLYSKAVAALPPEHGHKDDVDARWLKMARSVREVIALPVYKRTYARDMRPVYLRAIGKGIAEGSRTQAGMERILSLVEESSGRELLDMLASSRPPELGPPAHPLPWGTGSAGDTRAGRRAPVRAVDPADKREMGEMLAEREQQYEDHFLRHPLTSATHDKDIAHRLVQYTLNHPGSCVVRYFRFTGPGGVRPDGTGRPAPDSLGIMVCRDGLLTVLPPVPYQQVTELAGQFFGDIENSDTERPTPATCHRIWNLLIAPFWERANRGGPLTHLTVIPTDDIFAVPLHVATEPGDLWPLAARVPLSHSVSVAAFVSRGRHLLKKQLMEHDDDLAALMSTDESATGAEIVGTGWPNDRIHVAGKAPDGLDGGIGERAFAADWDGLAELVDLEPEFFVYAGHGTYVDIPEVSGPLISLGDADSLSQFDLALRVSLPRNKLTILGACLAGQGMRSESGDVLGFMRSLIISGAGAIGIPLWPVQDSAMVSTVGALLKQSREVLGTSDSGAFDVVQALHDHYRRDIRTYTTLQRRIDLLPIALYL